LNPGWVEQVADATRQANIFITQPLGRGNYRVIHIQLEWLTYSDVTGGRKARPYEL